jgi:hypothetical protein
MLDVRARMGQDVLENGSYQYMDRFGEVQPPRLPFRSADLETDTCGFATSGIGSRHPCRDRSGREGTEREAVASVTVPMVRVVHAGVAPTAEATASRTAVHGRAALRVRHRRAPDF